MYDNTEVNDSPQTSDDYTVPIFSSTANSPNSIDEARTIIELVILIAGLFLNILIFITIIVKSTLHTCTGCYLISLIVANFVILLDVLGSVIDCWFGDTFKPDVDFIGRVTLQATVCTIIIYSINQYVAFCYRKSSWYRILTKMSTAVKGVFIIWSFASITTAMELHLYDQFRKRTVINLYMYTTIMYLIMTTLIIGLLDIMIFLQLRETDDIIGKKKATQIDCLRLLGKINLIILILKNIN